MVAGAASVRSKHFVGDDGDALGGEGAQAPGVVEVVVAGNDVADRLARHQPPCLRDHRQGPLVVERPLGDDHVVSHPMTTL